MIKTVVHTNLVLYFNLLKLYNNFMWRTIWKFHYWLIIFQSCEMLPNMTGSLNLRTESVWFMNKSFRQGLWTQSPNSLKQSFNQFLMNMQRTTISISIFSVNKDSKYNHMDHVYGACFVILKLDIPSPHLLLYKRTDQNISFFSVLCKKKVMSNAIIFEFKLLL